MINRIVLVGRMVRDPELKYSQSGVAICRFSIAVNRAFKNAQGETEADFPNIVTFRKTAENVSNFLNKGSLVGIDGRIQTGSYTDQQGKKIFTTEIVADSVQFLEPKSNNQNNSQQAPQQPQTYGQTNTQTNYQAGQGGYGGQAQGYDVPSDVTDDDLPF